MTIAFELDDKEVLNGQPKDLYSNKLEIKVLYMICLKHHFLDLIIAVRRG